MIRGSRDLHDRRPAVRVSVEDRGSGIRDVDAERLFETFYTTKANGMGLGLAISRSIIQTHGGRLWASPNSGPGATFTFVLPVGGDAAA
jgi:signal transduction histidine kinase